MRFMAFHAIVRGATGLEWMLVRHPVNSPSFLDVRRVIGELGALHDLLASPTLAHEFDITYRELGFSDFDYVEMVMNTPRDANAIAIGHDPYVIIRPEGRWHRPGVLEASTARAVSRPSVDRVLEKIA